MKEELEGTEELNGHNSGRAGGEGLNVPLANLGKVVSNLLKFAKEHK